MSLWAFLAEALAISLSGVMAPGPLTTVTVGRGNQSPHAGALVAVGHGIVEMPLMALIFYGFGSLLQLPYVTAIIAFVGGLFLLLMGVDMLRSTRKQVELDTSQHRRSPVAAGILLSLGNPYFLIWWATVGASLILRAVRFGLLGLLTLALAHWMCDFLWSYFLSALSFKGGQFFGRSFQKVVFILCGILLLFFGGRFMLDAARAFIG